MAFELLAISLLYLVVTFILTALFVRLRSTDPLAYFYRKRFGFFPFFPVIILAQICLGSLRFLKRLARRFFEILSGRPTFTRKKNSYYGRGNTGQRHSHAPDALVEMKSAFGAKPDAKPKRINDNDSIEPVIRTKVSKY